MRFRQIALYKENTEKTVYIEQYLSAAQNYDKLIKIPQKSRQFKYQ